MDSLANIGIIVGILTGTSGLVLGILNAVHQKNITRARIKLEAHVGVVTRGAVFFNNDRRQDNSLILSIMNIGMVPTTIAFVGFEKMPRKTGTIALLSPVCVEGKTIPADILPGACLHIRINEAEVTHFAAKGNLGRAFVRTAIDQEFRCSANAINKAIGLLS